MVTKKTLIERLQVYKLSSVPFQKNRYLAELRCVQYTVSSLLGEGEPHSNYSDVTTLSELIIHAEGMIIYKFFATQIKGGWNSEYGQLLIKTIFI